MNEQFFPFKKIRKEQQNIIDEINKNLDKRYIIIEAGTGTGKSGIAIAAALSDGNGYVITDSLQLQDQYMSDFGGVSIANLKGKNNYRCTDNPKFSCEFGKCSVNSKVLANCIRNGLCPYLEARKKALGSNIFLTNYAYIILASEVEGLLKPRGDLIFDEAHLLENHLTEFCTLSLNVDDLEKTYSIMSEASQDEEKFLFRDIDSFNGDYTNFVSTLYLVCSRKFTKEKEAFEKEEKDLMSGNENDQELAAMLAEGHKKFYQFEKIIDNMNNYLSNPTSSNWIIDTKDNTLSIRPLKVDWVFKDYLDKLATEHIYFMSATILDKDDFCYSLGINPDEALFIREESSFDPDKSPIYGVCTCRTDYKSLQDSSNMQKVAEAVKYILNIYPDSKGIIHTGNMKISRYLKEHIDSDRLLVRDGEFTNRVIYEKHLKSKDPTVLVSSSMAEGVDLKDDLSRFQIIVKMPFESLADARVKKLIETRKNWYMGEMWKKMIQECGRSTRNENDHCDTYVLDASFWKWYKMAEDKDWFTDQFKKRVRKIGDN
jgi:ATP-dependent DNA helicase DinG